MKNYRYILEKYSKNQKVTCSNCGKRTFVRYIDTETGNILANNVGRCDRQEKCGYHFTPKQYFEQKGKEYIPTITNRIEQKKKIFFESYNKVTLSLSSELNSNNLYNFLIQYFEPNKVQKCFNDYKVGTSDKWNGAVIFWQIDLQNKVHSGKTMQYDPETGRRDKNKFSWNIIPDGYEREQCFFGLHLLKKIPPDYIIGIVESEKTALICDLATNDKIVWLASGGLNGLTTEKFKPLKSINRKIILFPDLSALDTKNSAFEIWKTKGEKIAKDLNLFNIKISNILESHASVFEKNKQWDLADFVLKNRPKRAIPFSTDRAEKRVVRGNVMTSTHLELQRTDNRQKYNKRRGL